MYKGQGDYGKGTRDAGRGPVHQGTSIRLICGQQSMKSPVRIFRLKNDN